MLHKVFCFILCMVSVSSQAKNHCSTLNEKILKKDNQIAPVWILSVQSKEHVYFHSAPSDNCKIKNLFIIFDDTVTGYNFYQDSKQEWIKVIYYSKRKDLESEIVEGWIKFRDLKLIPREFPH